MARPFPIIAPNTVPAFSAQTRLMVVAPHPDDETIATGVLIQQVLAAGGTVRIVLLTAGDNNPWPQRWLERRWRIDQAGRQRWGQRRQSEMLESLRCLGVPHNALQTIGWPDMGITDQLMQHTAATLVVISEAIELYEPTLVVLPAIEDRHPDHGAAHVLVRLALAGWSHQPQCWGYLIHGTAANIEQLELKASIGQSARKHAALEAHHTQMALSGRRMRRLADGDERYVMIGGSDTVLQAHPLPWQPPAWLQPWLRVSMVTADGAHDWRWRDAPLQRGDDGAWYLADAVVDRRSPLFVKLSWGVGSPWIFDYWGWCEA